MNIKKSFFHIYPKNVEIKYSGIKGIKVFRRAFILLSDITIQSPKHDHAIGSIIMAITIFSKIDSFKNFAIIIIDK